MAAFRPELEICPVCGSCGNCIIHSHYSRNLVDLVNGKVIIHELEVTRVVCLGCSKHVTHAILPDIIIPYSSYGLIFILHVLADLFSGLLTIVQICEKYDIAPTMIYRWKQAFLKHKDTWLGILDSAQTAPSDFLYRLMHMDSFSENFSAPFVCLTAFSFLQMHKSTAHYRRSVF